MDNDKQVRALLLKVPGNLDCADCGKTGKALVKFCSVKLGVFLCNQCYAAHRALGAHVTRGKCIGLDGLSDQEVELLTRLGNARVNAQYEANLPVGTKPGPTPCNGCSLSTCRDCKQRLRFIGDKYEKKLWFSETAAETSFASFPATTAPQQQQGGGGDDPFGLFSGQKPATTGPRKPTQSKPSDADFFASFGL